MITRSTVRTTDDHPVYGVAVADGRDMSRTAPLEWFAGRLRECRRRAGSPSLRALEELTQQLGRRYGRTSISDVLAAKSRPEWEFVESFVRACALFADASPTDLQRLDLDRWRQAHRRLLGELAYWRAGRRMASHAAAELRSTLPADVTPFVGRAEQLRTITRAITGQATSGGGAVSIHAIDGMPGVGKTALAVHVAHRVRNQFPDGQWFVDLHAHTPGLDPVRPADALTTLLLGDGADPGALPADLDARVAMWRDRTADKRALLILDNAVSSAQVEPLLPAGPGWLVLVTSRRHLGDLPAGTVPVPLDVLPPDQAERMFTTQAPGAAGDPAAVAELVALCGYLPLAVSLLARLSATHPTWTLGDLIAETRARLLTATAESSSVAAAFDPLLRAIGLPGESAAALVAQFVHFSAGYAIVASLLDGGILTLETALVTLVLGSMVVITMIYVKYSVPLYLSLFGRLGVKIALVTYAASMAAKVVTVALVMVVL